MEYEAMPPLLRRWNEEWKREKKATEEAFIRRERKRHEDSKNSKWWLRWMLSKIR